MRFLFRSFGLSFCLVSGGCPRRNWSIKVVDGCGIVCFAVFCQVDF